MMYEYSVTLSNVTTTPKIPKYWHQWEPIVHNTFFACSQVLPSTVDLKLKWLTSF